jgi:Cytochrome c7 and related cytochrome c
MQIFSKDFNKRAVYLLVGLMFSLFFIVFAFSYYGSPDFLVTGYKPTQPIPFSHQKHVGNLNISCQYCHSTVAKADFAALPPAATCMGCHAKVATDSPAIKKLTEYYKTNTPIPWVHVHYLARYAHFSHQAHIAAQVGCVQCHGRIDQMEVVEQVSPLSMGWCLQCHRDPSHAYVDTRHWTDTIPNTYDPIYKGKVVTDFPKNPNDWAVHGPTSCGACHY